MTLFDVLRILQRFWALIVFLVALGLGGAAGALMLAPPSYNATARLFVSTQSLGTADELLQGSTYTQARIMSYAQVATDPIVLEPVIEQLGLDRTPGQLAEQVEATAERDRLILELEVTADDPATAADIVNAVAEELSSVITDTIEAPVAGSDPIVSVTILKNAVAAESPAWPVPWIFFAVGGLAGLLLGLGTAFLIGALDTRLRSVDDARTLTDRPVLGMIARDRKISRHSIATEMTGRSQFAEAIRGIRTNLQFIDAGGERKRVLLVTSSIPGEGKSTTAASIAMSLAEVGKSVVLLDADLRSPQIATILDVEGTVGLTDVLIGRLSLDAAMQPAGFEGRLEVLAAGRVPPNPAELLASPAFSAMLNRIRSHVDYVIIDSPPVLPVTDAAVLSQVVDATLLIVGAEHVRRPQLQTTLTRLQQVQADIAGIVVNRLARTGVDSYAYYVYGEYGQRPADDPPTEAADAPADATAVETETATESR